MWARGGTTISGRFIGNGKSECAYLLREFHLLRALFSRVGDITPTIIKVVFIVFIVVGRIGFDLEYCCRVYHEIRVLAPAFANGYQISSGEALGMVGLGLGYEFVNDARLGEIGIPSGFRCGNGCIVFVRGFDEEGDVCVG
jgi:hypothetical protein